MTGWQRIFISLILSLYWVVGTSQPVTFEYLSARNGLPQSTIRGIVKDKYGFMWFGTWNGLCRYDGYSFKVYRAVIGDTTSIASNRIHYLYKDKNGDIWISLFNKIVCRYNYQTDNFSRFKLTDLPLSLQDSVNRMHSLDAFNKYAAMLTNLIGPFHLSQTNEHIVFQPTAALNGALSDNNVNCMLLDNTGILWLGTGAGGINKADLNASKFYYETTISKTGNKNFDAVRSLIVNEKYTWVGTEDDGVLLVSKNNKTQSRLSSKLDGENIKMLFDDGNGSMWIGKRSGLDRYDLNTGNITKLFSRAVSDSFSRFYTAAVDPVTKEIWFASYRGLFKYLPVTKSFQKQLLSAYGTSGAGNIFFDRENDLWIGTEYSGLIHIKRDATTNKWKDTVIYTGLGSDPRSPDERIYSIDEDQNGFIWVGTANGLCKIDRRSKAIRSYTTKDGLPDQYITKVMVDDKGFVWFAHKNGISKMNTQTGVLLNYSVKRPGQEYEFMDGSGFYDKAGGEMYFGTTQGYIHFKPTEIKANSFLPNVAFTALQILNKPVNVGDTIHGRRVLSAPLFMSKTITLGYEDKSFSIEFSALHYADPARNKYAYMLEGQDKDWIYTDADRRIASYSNLSAGKYVLKVKASNNDGVWNEQPASLTIIILPPWWRSGWAYLIYFLLFITAIYIVYRLVQIRQLYHRQILTERLKAEKAQELDQLKSSFFTNISHEFRTPLTLIVDPLRSLLTQKDADAKNVAHYNVMYRNAQRLLALINQFLDFRKLEAGKIQLQPKLQDVVVFVKNIAAAFDFQAEEKRITYKLRCSQDKIIMGFDADIVGKILYNLISNAFKFTISQGAVSVEVFADSQLPQEVKIYVKDNGVGIAADKLDKVFEPFFQIEGEKQNIGTGVGLSLTKELVELHKGNITVTSNPGVETCFTVTISNIATKESGMSQQPDIETIEEEMPLVTDTALPSASKDKAIVLLVEDNEDIRQYIKQNLANTYQILEAANGIEGLDAAIINIPDIIISDVMMPGMNGLELCTKLKTDERTSHIPIILLTARQSDQYEAEGYETGADAYIVKPFSMPLLQVRVKGLLENRARLRTLFSQSPESYTHPVGLNAADKTFLVKITELIEENIGDEDVNVEWLARQLFMSRTQLYRKVKAITDQSVHELVTGIRLSKAAALLLEGELSVTEIAYKIGYADATSFSRMFQKQYGTTPKKYSTQNG